MNPLAELKQKLMVKPTVQERERVAIVIKGDTNSKAPPKKYPKKTIVKRKLPTEEKESAEEQEVDVEEAEEEEETHVVGAPETIKRGPLIIDETDKGFDRETLLKRLKESKLTKVSVKPTVEKAEEIKHVAPELLQPAIKKAVKFTKKMPLIIEDEDDEDDEGKKKEGKREEKKEPDIIVPIKAPKNTARKTEKIKRGVAILGAETVVELGDTDLTKRLPKRSEPINIKVSSYYMNNREIFINFINSLFEPYRLELQQNKEGISCDDIGNTTSDFSLLTHQKIVRDYMNLYTPYRGLLLYHGLGSGKTCTSIAIAEGMKDSKRIVIMTPASLRANYIEELKKCGDSLYKRNQFWEWISTDLNPEAAQTMSAILNLPMENISRHRGAWFVNVKKKSNYNELTDTDKKTLDAQLDIMIKTKYTFINYNGLRTQKLSDLTAGFTKNLFDNSVIIIDEAHNLISRIVNKIKKEKPIVESKRGEKEHMPLNLATKLYEFLLSAKNAKIVLLTGTPVINYPNEFGILFNILRGYIKTWRIPVKVNTSKKIDKASLQEMLLGEKTLDYLDYSPSSKIITVTRNPFGFKNKIKVDSGYQGVSNAKKDASGQTTIETENTNDDEFERKIISILKRNDIEVVSDGIEIKNKKALPDTFDLFESQYIDGITKKIKNVDALKRRIVGLSSYFRSAQENLLPKYSKILGVDYHIVRIPMSDFQFKIYEAARHEERKSEKPKKAPSLNDVYKDSSSTYRIFSRLYCNFVMPDRPLPKGAKITVNEDHENLSTRIKQTVKTKVLEIFTPSLETLLNKSDNELDKKHIKEFFDNTIDRLVEITSESVINSEKNAPNEFIAKLKDEYLGDLKTQTEEGKLDALVIESIGHSKIDISKEIEDFKKQEDTRAVSEKDNVGDLLKDAENEERRQDVNDGDEGEVEGDVILDKIGGTDYKERIQQTLKNIETHSNDFLTPEALQTFSPKFLNMMENIKDPEYAGLHLVYSQFRTMEGIGIFTLVLDKNGFTRFKIKKNTSGVWAIDIAPENKGKPTYALYTGTEESDEKEIMRHIYNGEWDQVPESISIELRKIAKNNNMGEIVKVFMITSSGSEGINLRNTRFVHIMEPYWHPVRLEQVIGRARRICSHKSLPPALQTVEVFVYLMIFTPSQLKSENAIELKRKDLSKGLPKVPITSDQYLYEISEIKSNLTAQLTDAIKESSFDCYIYSNGKCVNFGNPTNNKFSYVPDFSEQQNDTTVQANKVAIEWVGKPVTLNGTRYVYRRINNKLLNIYDLASYEAALKDSSIIPLQIGTLETNERGEQVFKQLVT
jgi:hypothetical protein